jgi:general secretion pathway protein A
MAFIATEVAGIAEPPSSISESIQRLQSFLIANKAEGKHAVIAIDEAHCIEDQQTLEALRMLTNFQTDGQPNITMLMVGQPQLLAMLERNPLGERVDVRTLLRPFNNEETASYVNHRLQTAGAERAIFEDAAIDMVYELSNGVPRKINRLCDLALLIGFADEKPSISGFDIEAVSEEMVAIAPE